ncbi:MAG: P1 family peptidase [Inquilinaceae bacterium]
MIRPGPRNLITDVPGILVGNAEDAAARTGVTAILAEGRAVAAVDVRGGGPGTRETDALNPTGLIDAIDAVVLSGGSVFGLDAASGVVSWLAGQGRGFRIGPAVAPIVPAAVLFDLGNGGDKDWGTTPPYRALGWAACETAGSGFALGNAGAGLGAKAGGLKGGLGSASWSDSDSGFVIGALAAANPNGSAVMPGQSTLWAWALEQDDELGGQPPPSDPVSAVPELAPPALPGASTVLGVIAVNADLTKGEAWRVAAMAQDGLARAIRPSHTPFDGDTVFVLATGAVPMPAPRPASIAWLGALAADALARAVARAVYEAEGLGDKPGYRAVHGAALRAARPQS